MAVAMKYLKEEDLKDRKGNKIVIPVPMGVAEPEKPQQFEPKVLTTGLFAYLAADAYTATQGYIMKPSDQRHWYSLLDKLEGDPIQGYWELDEHEFSVLKQCLENIAPLIPVLQRHQVPMDDAMQAVKSTKPEVSQ